MGPEGPIGPVVGNPVKKSHFARTCAQNEISLGKNYMDMDGNSCGNGFKKSHFARIRAQNEISLEKKLYGYGWKQLWNAK